MPNTRTLQRAFSGGEVTPEFYGRIDDVKYQSGAAVLRNYIALPHGPAANRAGFAFVREVKNSAARTRIISFAYSTSQTFVIELGAGYFRFHTLGATLMNGSVPYEVVNPYAEQDLFDIHYVQSADVLTLVHPNYPPKELRRLGALNWVLSEISFAPTLAAPTGVTATATQAPSPNNLQYYRYKVTAVGAGTDESMGSAIAQTNIENNLLQTGAYNDITWQGVTGALRYNVYCESNGLFGYIGQTGGLTFRDDNIAPDISQTPPIPNTPFTIISGRIQSVPIAAGGSGYGTAATSGGEITAISVDDGGSGYTSPTLTVAGPTGSGASFTVNVDGTGAISSIDVDNSGSGYTHPVFTLSDTGTGAKINPTVTPVVYAVPTLTVTDTGGGAGAVLSPVVAGGIIVDVAVQDPGHDYVNPVVSVADVAGGSGAAFGPPVLTTAGGYPGAVTYFEQRRCFAGTGPQPQNFWMTRSGTESSLTYSIPSRADDAIAYRIAAREVNTIRHMVPLANLVLLTNSAEWRVAPVNSDVITPQTTSARAQSFVGANNVQPAVVNNNLIYIAARGGHARELSYSWQANGYITGDLSLRAPHLFDTYEVVDMAYAKSPYPICWCVSSNGVLLGLTYVPEQQVGGWHHHDTDGVFESVAVVTEGSEDVLYAIVRRVIGGVSRRYVERMATRLFSDPADAFFVDAGATYSGDPVMALSGLDHLEGKTVNILADGAVAPQRVVTGGAVTLDQPASKIQVGLPIVADLQTLPLAMQIDPAYGQGHAKNVNKVWLRVNQSSGIFAGPDADHLVQYKQRTNEPYGTPPALRSGEIDITLTPSWTNAGGQILVRQSDPLPMTIVSLNMEVAVGG